MGGSSLLAGAALGLRVQVSERVIGAIMAFGSGVLISALTFELTLDAHERGGADAVAIGLALGALAFFSGNAAVVRRGGHDRKSPRGQEGEGSPNALAIGAILDGIPESMAIGASLIAGAGVSAAVVAAVFLSNMPEALASATGMRRDGHPPRRILGMWAAVVAVAAVASVFGYAVLSGAGGETIALVQAFAAGAILTMLADTMIPEAFEKEDRSLATGLVTVFGFALAFLLSTVD